MTMNVNRRTPFLSFTNAPETGCPEEFFTVPSTMPLFSAARSGKVQAHSSIAAPAITTLPRKVATFICPPFCQSPILWTVGYLDDERIHPARNFPRAISSGGSIRLGGSIHPCGCVISRSVPEKCRQSHPVSLPSPFGSAVKIGAVSAHHVHFFLYEEILQGGGA